jgi:uncharacterized 2Fe-2S/4Fe-4S cluster protein (DUF4445 family)
VVDNWHEITFLPDQRVIRVRPGTDLFTAANSIGLTIDSTCGGLGTCGLCRVRIVEGSIPVSDADREYLSRDEHSAGWRLACRANVEGPTTCLVPETLKMPMAAMSGLSRPVALEPAVHKIFVELPRPSSADTRGDLRRLRRVLKEAGFAFDAELGSIRQLPGALRETDFEATAVLCGPHLVALEPGDTRESCFGLALDLGTTTVVGSLIDLTTGQLEAQDSVLNGQAVYGADVITRIGYTMVGDDQRHTMREAVIASLNELFLGLLQQAGVEKKRVYETVVVGNTTMLHLLTGVDAGGIAVAPFVPVFTEALDLTAAQLGLDLNPSGRVSMFPTIGAYVGADTVAGLHATGMAWQEGLHLFIDVGTNSEIALGSREAILATSAPAGPAFEGGGVRHGMMATEGAIAKVGLGEEVRLEVIGDGAPRGLCGSGLIDAAAELRRIGFLEPTGLLKQPGEVRKHPLVDRLVEVDGTRAFRLCDDIVITQRDIRELQSAKSAIATGVQVLMQRLGVEPADLQAVLLAGSFGSAIDPASARILGLVPQVPLERINFVGNVAAEGAKMALVSFREKQAAFSLAENVEYLELSARPDFNDLFVATLHLPPMESGP